MMVAMMRLMVEIVNLRQSDGGTSLSENLYRYPRYANVPITLYFSL